MTKLIIGLGNPSPKYASTRHNVGWMVLDLLAKHLNLEFTNHARTESVIAAGKGFKLLKPQTFMNDSGRAVAKAARYFDIPSEDIIVVHDDIDLPLAAIRRRLSGSSGGHNGVQSIIEQLHTKDFARIKIGIDRPTGRITPASYVLQPFTKTQLTDLKPALEKAVDLLLKEL
ncbi:MAG: aminoacyl-tRNA hydrolase [Patescibacteria group bacterium]|jgi:PTH1 family peptidyl-tRNA hydrolase